MTDFHRDNSGGMTDPRRISYFVYKTRSGRTLIGNKPGRVGSMPRSVQETVRRAVTYAGFACEEPFYQSRAIGTSMTAYSLALADYLGKPQVLDVDLREWTRGGDQTIQVRARDNFLVLRVRLVIWEGDCILEEGEAIQSDSDQLNWTYAARTATPRQPGLTLEAFAYDLPGNIGEYSFELR